ncbi:MAG: type II 3-dehydroquinate dehydratase [Christensenellaceae bacterium]|jgi:3-dehydroquinate dehydratase-2
MISLLVINGPNLNMLGIREPAVYGSGTLEDLNKNLLEHVEGKDVSLDFFQSNHEGALIDALHEAHFSGVDGIVLNAGALTHYSYALHDAISSIGIPCVEVHLSDINKREPFRKVSVIREVCVASFFGMGEQSYIKGLDFLITLARKMKERTK